MTFRGQCRPNPKREITMSRSTTLGLVSFAALIVSWTICPESEACWRARHRHTCCCPPPRAVMCTDGNVCWCYANGNWVIARDQVNGCYKNGYCDACLPQGVSPLPNPIIGPIFLTGQMQPMVAKNGFMVIVNINDPTDTNRKDMLYDQAWAGRRCGSDCSVCQSNHTCYYYQTSTGTWQDMTTAHGDGNSCDACIPSGQPPSNLDPSTVHPPSDPSTSALFVMTPDSNNYLRKVDPQPQMPGTNDQAYKYWFEGAKVLQAQKK